MCYNKGTEAGSNEVADAVEISADDPTVTPVTRCFPRERGHKNAAALTRAAAYSAGKPALGFPAFFYFACFMDRLIR